MRGFLKFLLLIVVAVSVAAIARYTRPKPKAETVPLPDRTYSKAAFDSVTWDNEMAEIARGQQVFGWVCAKCHGPEGRGDGGYVLEGDTLHPPSFVQPNWRFASATEALWQRIYLGNNRGMPHWGDQGLEPRDVMAVATYIQKSLRRGVANPAAPAPAATK